MASDHRRACARVYYPLFFTSFLFPSQTIYRAQEYAVWTSGIQSTRHITLFQLFENFICYHSDIHRLYFTLHLLKSLRLLRLLRFLKIYYLTKWGCLTAGSLLTTYFLLGIWHCYHHLLVLASIIHSLSDAAPLELFPTSTRARIISSRLMFNSSLNALYTPPHPLFAHKFYKFRQCLIICFWSCVRQVHSFWG